MMWRVCVALFRATGEVVLVSSFWVAFAPLGGGGCRIQGLVSGWGVFSSGDAAAAVARNRWRPPGSSLGGCGRGAK